MNIVKYFYGNIQAWVNKPIQASSLGCQKGCEMKTRVASHQVMQSIRAMQQKSSICAWKVECKDEEGNISETRNFSEAKHAHSFAIKQLKKGVFKTSIFENIGNKQFIMIVEYEKDQTQNKQIMNQETQELKPCAPSATGETQEQRWKNAMNNKKVPVILRRTFY